MEILLDKKGNTEAVLKIQLKAADYQPKISAKLKEYGKKVSLKGFRQGKVPAQVVEKMYGKSIKIEEVNQILMDAVSKYVKDQNLNIIGYPIPNVEEASKIDWDTQNDFDFYYDLGLIPEFKYELSDKIKINSYEIEANEEKANETLDNLRRQYGKMEDADAVEIGDFINGDLKEVSGEFESKTLLPSNRFVKSAHKLFAGKKVGDVISFDIEKIFEDASHIAHATGLSKEEAENKKGAFTFEITGIRRSTPAPLDQDFFDKMFGKDVVTTEEELRSKLLETIKENYSREAKALVAKEIRSYFLKNVSIDLSGEFLKKWLLLNNDGKLTKEQVEKDFDLYVEDLKWLLIRNKIGEDLGLKVEHTEIVDRVKAMFGQQFGMMTISEEMQETMNKIAENYLTSENGKNYQRVFEEVFYSKVLETIESKVTLNAKKIKVEEFEKLLQA